MGKSASDVSDRPERYYKQRRPEMLKYVPASVKRTLDLGCAAGNFSELIKTEYDAECWGVEMDHQAAQIASTKLDKIIAADVTQCLEDLPDNYFDCVICNDILEHLADPFGLLIDLKKKMTVDGIVIASFPNIRYCRILFDLVMRGNWDYKEHGILDKTHLRFFTHNSILKMFPALGYELLTIEGLEPDPSALSRLVKFVNLLLLNRFKDTIYHHFACVARPVRRSK
ncbi:MAG: class I SAM-dependent methyltransferase [Phycisphaerales bacterium]|nr:MAG: class I SAM-dependent methyltransferase [Phycisphaerales bacterium]